jgi:4-hydroxythreonine-4-phosphate dehydrogenase
VKRVAITMGEPGGIGPEVALKAVSATLDICDPVLVGDLQAFSRTLESIGLELPLKLVEDPEDVEPGTIQVLDTGRAEYTTGEPTVGGGQASVEAIRRAVELAKAGKVHAVVTAPISKEALKMAGYKWPGHTEMLAELTGTKDYAMMLVGGGLRVILVTIHVSYAEVTSLITRESVLRTLRLAKKAAAMLDVKDSRIAVCGLNPHAGEGGMFGAEEREIIAPAIEEAQKEGIPASGPYPPDTVFFRAARGEFDLVVAMCHDQGLIPLKLLAFEEGVNVTVGLPIIRTSPDHGTAYEIAGKGMANPMSMTEAIRLALRLRV